MNSYATFPDFSLRGLTRADGKTFVRYLNDLSVAGWLAQPPYPYRIEHADDYFDRKPAGWPRRAGIEVDGELVGMVSIDPHLGYWLAPGHHGRGIMSRAADAIVGAHFSATGADEISSGIFEGNAASAAVLRRLGFREAGRTLEFCRPLGVERPHIGYRLSRADWRSGETREPAKSRASGEPPVAHLSYEQSWKTLPRDRADAVWES